MANIATLIGSQGIDEFKAMVPATLNFGVTPVEVKEIIYLAIDYLGIGRISIPSWCKCVLTARILSYRLKDRVHTTTEIVYKGIQAQVDIVGDGMKNSISQARKNHDTSIIG